MKKPLNIKKFLLPNIPYVFIALFATKLGQAWRLAPGMDFSGKALHLMEGFAAAFQSALPSFHPIDLCVGVAAALLIRLAVYVKGKTPRNSARIWNTALPVGAGPRISPLTSIRSLRTTSFSPGQNGS